MEIHITYKKVYKCLTKHTFCKALNRSKRSKTYRKNHTSFILDTSVDDEFIGSE